MNFLNNALHRVLLVLFGAATVFMVVEPYTDAGFVEPLSILVFAIGLFFVLRLIWRKLAVWDKKRLKLLTFGLFIVFILIQIWWVNAMHTELFGDPWHIQTQAERLVQGSHVWDLWIRQYPNLLPMIALNMGFIKLASFLHLNFYALFFGFNILINTAIWAVVVRFLWRIKPNFAAFAILLTVMMPYMNSFLIQVGYSDGVAMLAMVLLANEFDKALTRKYFGIRQGLLCTLIFTFAYLARPNSVIMLAALVILGILTYAKREKYENFWKIALKLGLTCLGGIVLATLALHGIAAFLGYDLHNNNVFPTLNWVYESINLKSFGEWTPSDRLYTLYHKGYETAAQADWAGILGRLKEYNVLILPLWVVKFATLWSTGTFATGTDYTMFSWYFNWTHAPAFWVQNIGAINIFLETYSKALVAVLLFAIFYCLRKKKRDVLSSWGLLLLGIMGISLFHTLLWEVKPRYQLMTFGLLMIASIWSLREIFDSSSPFLAKSEPLPAKGKATIKHSVSADKDEKDENVIHSEKWTTTQSQKWHRRLKILLPVVSIASIILMATAMQLQAKQIVMATAQQHPTDNYGYSNDDLTLAPHETISQEVTLPVAVDRFSLQTGVSRELKLKIQKKTGNTWSDWSDHIMPKDNVKRPLVPDDAQSEMNASLPSNLPSQTFDVAMPAGTYRLVVTNPNDQSASIEALRDTTILDYPTRITLPDGKTASFSFSFWQSQTVSKYPLGLIIVFAILLVLANLAVIFLW